MCSNCTHIVEIYAGVVAVLMIMIMICWWLVVVVSQVMQCP